VQRSPPSAPAVVFASSLTAALYWGYRKQSHGCWDVGDRDLLLLFCPSATCGLRHQTKMAFHLRILSLLTVVWWDHWVIPLEEKGLIREISLCGLIIETATKSCLKLVYSVFIFNIIFLVPCNSVCGLKLIFFVKIRCAFPLFHIPLSCWPLPNLYLATPIGKIIKYQTLLWRVV